MTSIPPPGFEPPPSHSSMPNAEPVRLTTPPGPTRRRFQLTGRSKLLAGALALVVAVAVAFVLLGSTNSPVSDPIAQAATLSSNAPGYRMNLALSISSPSLTQPVTGTGTAIVDLRDQTASIGFSLDFAGEPQVAQTLGSSTMNMAMILEHGVMYMKLPAVAMQEIPGMGGKQWLKLDVPKSAGVPGMGSLGSSSTMTDPGRMLQYLRAAASSITNDGTQDVNGVQTTHYHVLLELQNLAANLPPAEQNAVQRSLSQLEQETGSVTLPVDVWIDEQHFVRRIAMSFSMREGNGGTLQEGITADLTDYGPQPQPKLPPDAQVQDLSGMLNSTSNF